MWELWRWGRDVMVIWVRVVEEEVMRIGIVFKYILKVDLMGFVDGFGNGI